MKMNSYILRIILVTLALITVELKRIIVTAHLMNVLKVK